LRTSELKKPPKQNLQNIDNMIMKFKIALTNMSTT